MQLVRVLSGNYEISLRRKALEIFIAVKLTNKLKKREILRLYLSVAYFGWNMHGIIQACSHLYIELFDLSFHGAAGLIARYKIS